MNTVVRSFFCVLLVFSVSFSSSYVDKIEKVGTEKNEILFVAWNAEKFGRSKTPDVIAYMAKVLRNADIVQLEEVSTKDFGAQAVAKLCDELNRTGAKWDYAVTPPTHDCFAKESYGYLWKTKRIKIATQARLASDMAANMGREPGLINFIIDGNLVNFAAIHLSPTAKHPKNEVDYLVSRAIDFFGENFILSGDFNLSYKQIGSDFEKQLNIQHCIEGKTSIKNKLDADGEHLNKEYDNIYTRGVKVVRAGIMDFYPAFNNFKEVKKISDHCPVFIIFKF